MAAGHSDHSTETDRLRQAYIAEIQPRLKCSVCGRNGGEMLFGQYAVRKSREPLRDPQHDIRLPPRRRRFSLDLDSLLDAGSVGLWRMRSQLL